MEKVRILVADDHPIVRDGLKAIISDVSKYLVIGEASDGAEVCDKVLELKPDIVIMDIVMPRMDGILATEYIRRSSPKTKVIILSVHKDREYALRAFRAGAEGYVLKELVSGVLLTAISSVISGKRYACPAIAEHMIDEYMQKAVVDDPFDSLSLRQKEVLKLVIEGKTNTEIAEILCVSLSTVKTHRNSLMKKLDVHDVASLTKLAIKKGFIHTTD
jgi:RNA polymerase sigma factor (sigma-70 family)